MSNTKSANEPGKSEPAKTPANARGISDREFVLEHSFPAPAPKVFAAYTDPKLVAQWWVPTGGALRVEAMDVRPGGKWRFVQPLPSGQEVVYAGVYVEVRPTTRLVYTLIVEGQPWSEVMATVDLQEADGNTRLTLTNLCMSKEACEAIVKYGAAAGANMQWQRLAALLARA